MNNSYVIQWKSKVNGRTGRGTKRFEKEEAVQLAEELNCEYPQIEHQAVSVPEPEPQTQQAPAPAEEPGAPVPADTEILSVA